MERDHVCTLIGTTHKPDALSQQVSTETRREVFCTVGSVQQSEFFAAGRNGLKPRLCAKVFCDDYQNENVVEVDGVRYGVYRTYLNDNYQMELYLERKGGV